MQGKLEAAVRGVTTTTYGISASLVAGDWLSFLDHHAAAIGVILGGMTFITNFIFQLLNHRAIRAKTQDAQHDSIH